jgi:hypothetical protein
MGGGTWLMNPMFHGKSTRSKGAALLVVVFDGITTASCYINFVFKIQSFAMKILMPKWCVHKKPMPMLASALSLFRKMPDLPSTG